LRFPRNARMPTANYRFYFPYTESCIWYFASLSLMVRHVLMTCRTSYFCSGVKIRRLYLSSISRSSLEERLTLYLTFVSLQKKQVSHPRFITSELYPTRLTKPFRPATNTFMPERFPDTVTSSAVPPVQWKTPFPPWRVRISPFYYAAMDLQAIVAMRIPNHQHP